MVRRKRVSLSNELHVVIDSMGGLRSLTRQWVDAFGTEPHLPDQVLALLSILIERLRVLDRAVRGTADPFLVWSRQNDADLTPGDPHEEDVVLTSWSDRRLLRHHRKATRALKRRLRATEARGDERPDPEGT